MELKASHYIARKTLLKLNCMFSKDRNDPSTKSRSNAAWFNKNAGVVDIICQLVANSNRSCLRDRTRRKYRSFEPNTERFDSLAWECVKWEESWGSIRRAFFNLFDAQTPRDHLAFRSLFIAFQFKANQGPTASETNLSTRFSHRIHVPVC